MAYNMTNVTDANNLFEIVGEVNKASDGYMFGFGMLAFYTITMMVFKNQDIVFVFIVDSFIMSILFTLAFVFGFIGLNLLIIPILLFFAGLIVKLFVPR